MISYHVTRFEINGYNGSTIKQSKKTCWPDSVRFVCNYDTTMLWALFPVAIKMSYGIAQMIEQKFL